MAATSDQCCPNGPIVTRAFRGSRVDQALKLIRGLGLLRSLCRLRQILKAVQSLASAKALRLLGRLQPDQRPKTIQKLACFLHRRGCDCLPVVLSLPALAAKLSPLVHVQGLGDGFVCALEQLASTSTERTVGASEAIDQVAKRIAGKLARFKKGEAPLPPCSKLADWLVASAQKACKLDPSHLAAKLVSIGAVSAAGDGRLCYHEDVLAAVPAMPTKKIMHVAVPIGFGVVAAERVLRLKSAGFGYVAEKWLDQTFGCSVARLADRESGLARVETSERGQLVFRFAFCFCKTEIAVDLIERSPAEEVQALAEQDIEQNLLPPAFSMEAPKAARGFDLCDLEQTLQCGLSLHPQGEVLIVTLFERTIASRQQIRELIHLMFDEHRSCHCCELLEKQVPHVIGKGGVVLRKLEAAFQVRLSLDQTVANPGEKRRVRAWLAPSLPLADSADCAAEAIHSLKSVWREKLERKAARVATAIQVHLERIMESDDWQISFEHLCTEDPDIEAAREHFENFISESWLAGDNDEDLDSQEDHGIIEAKKEEEEEEQEEETTEDVLMMQRSWRRQRSILTLKRKRRMQLGRLEQAATAHAQQRLRLRPRGGRHKVRAEHAAFSAHLARHGEAEE
mmetsp:Transcript_53017/g.139060  ORF Transcript_53017/g.139060 Transcript_53017/m.139060 type:complete len:625 (+) Transcript_53017:57-1931(+)